LLLGLERLATRCTDVVVANSAAVRQDTLERERLDPAIVRVIHNGLAPFVDVPDARERLRRGLRTSVEMPVAVMVANLIAYKGHDVLLPAWRHVLERHPTAMLWLVGEGPERGRLETLAHTLGIETQIRFAGSRVDVRELLAAADVLVHASREEGFSNAILEGMAAGLPVVATAVGGNPEAVVEGETGVLVPADDAVALASAIDQVIDNSTVSRAWGTAGRARVAASFTIDQMVAAYEMLYAELLIRKGQA